jgi:DNA-directed RNA polymerase specialized sigma24 family protein
VPTQAVFDRLLAWLDPERERAAEKYEEIRRRLIKIFACRGCLAPEDAADRTINRVTGKLQELPETCERDPIPYFYAVAKWVHQEEARDARPAPTLAATASPGPVGAEDECLRKCLERLPAANRDLILEYYREERKAKIDYRKDLAARLGIEPNALRIKVCRIRATLKECLGECVKVQR